MTQVFVTADKLERNGRFIDLRFDLQNPEKGQALYKESHINGAIFWDLEFDLSDMRKKEGRHPLPDKQVLQNLFEQSGLSYNEAIYIYDQGGAPFASRAWWILRYAGFKYVYVVNGGFESLVEAGFETTTEVPHFERTELTLQWNDTIFANRVDVKRIVDGQVKATLLDARSVGRYRGDFEPNDPIAGHIPTAKNFDWEQLRDGNLIVANNELFKVVSKEESIVVYCGSGVTATPLYTILEEAGYKNIRLYAGGYSDWLAEHEIELGENK